MGLRGAAEGLWRTPFFGVGRGSWVFESSPDGERFTTEGKDRQVDRGRRARGGIARRRGIASLSDALVRVGVRRLLLGAVPTGGGGGAHPGGEVGLAGPGANDWHRQAGQ